MFVTPYPTHGAVKTHIGKSTVCLAASLHVKEVELQTGPTVATGMVGGTCTAGPAAVHRICYTNSLVDVLFVL